jgi:hypothetical protein
MTVAELVQSQFAELHGVNRSTVTGWKRRGYLVFTRDGLVDVAKSNAALARRPAGAIAGNAGTACGY